MEPSSELKVFSFNIYAHKSLEREKIHHEIAENYLSYDDRLKVFDTTISLYDWYKQKSATNDVRLEGVNLFEILDTTELHIFLIKTIHDFLLIKRILEKENPKKITTNQYLSKLVEPLITGSDIELNTYTNDSEHHLEWDVIEIKFNLGKIPISFHISRTKYNKLKDTLESILGSILDLWFDFDNRRKTILLLEFNPSAYKDLLKNLAKYDKNVVLLNRRRSAIWNLESIKILNKTKCKMLNFKKMLTKDEKQNMAKLVNEYHQKLNIVLTDDLLVDVFSIEGNSFWPCIKDILVQTYQHRLPEYVNFILIAKKILDKINPTCIVSLNVVGETEKTILAINRKLIPSIMLEHGYANYTKEISRYDALSMYPLLKDKIAVWGEVQKQYIISQHNLEPDRIVITGSPKHDSFFKRKAKSDTIHNTVLITIHPITEISGQADSNLYVKFENSMKELCRIVKKLDNVKIIVKLHPGQDLHNNDIKTIFKEIDPTIPVYQLKPIVELIERCDVVINISPEGFDPSTVIFESMIMKKPVVNIILDGKLFEFQYVKDGAVVTLFDVYELEEKLHEILFDKQVRDQLIENGQKHLINYLSNPATASESFAGILASY